ncbi:MAG: amino acid/amide transporter rane protein 2, family, amino acid/amide transporter [Bradyrhizobium sp.]|jgi:branched-chain amino acid transport system permease protein|nr:amino acid/amide transporter rane protein 2, family, amino acid/amide transporter [Bradyrhizobium sp.]
MASAAARSKERLSSVKGAATAAILLAVGLLPLFGSDYLRFVAILILINTIAATGVNLSMGYCGLVSVGHAGFVALGAYVAAFCINHLTDNVVVALIASALTAGSAGLIIGLPTLRLNSLYIAMVTFGFGQAINLIAVNWIEVTGGPNGLQVNVPSLFGQELSNTALYLTTVVLCAVSIWVARSTSRSRLGRSFLAIKESEIAAQSMGIGIARYKTIAFGMSAVLGGVAGALYALASGYVNPDAFVFQISVLLVTMCVAGGLGTVAGPIVGAIILTILPEFLRPFAEYKELFSGLILLAFLVLMPRGIVPLVDAGVAAIRLRSLTMGKRAAQP